MYNVFTNSIYITKGKNCVCEKSMSLDAQKVYASLLDVYHDHLSTKLSATKLCQELTLMKLDYKWRKSFESFLHFWTAKAQHLEGIEDKLVDDDTRRIWMTITLSSQPDMDAAIRQSITTELTINGTQGFPAAILISWTNFYNMVPSNAKLLDSTCSKQLGRKTKTNQAQTNRNNNCGTNNCSGTNSANSNSNTTTPKTKWTGKAMVMKKGMSFSNEDWAECTLEQKKKIWDFRKQKAKASNTTVAVNSTVVQPTAPTPPTASPPAPTPHIVVANATDVCHLLSNNTSRDSSAPPSHVVIAWRTYALSYCARTYAIHQNEQQISVLLIDGGPNGGLSRSDVVIIEETLLTADVTGIANNTLQKVLNCIVAGLIQTQHDPIIGIFHQYAHHGTGKTIHSASQLRDFETIVDDTSHCFNGKQRLETLDGYIIPLSISLGLPYMDISPPTSSELDTYPHVFFTSDIEWNPQGIVDEYPIHELDLTDNDLQHNDYHPDTLNVYGELTLQGRQQDIHNRNRRRNHPDVDILSPNF
jgi:hypothetical protein